MDQWTKGEMGQPVTSDIGGRLQRAREARDLSLRDIALRTRLTISVLQAIERNDFASLPGGLFRRAYLRTVAREVGLDGEEIAAEYMALFEPPTDIPPTPDEQATVERKWIQQLAPSPGRSIISLALLALPSIAWFLLMPAATVPTLAVDNSEGIIFAQTRVDAASNAQGAILDVAARSESQAAPVSVAIQASGWCWVAAEADGERVMYRMVEPGEQLRLEAQRLISLRLGDAGAVTLSINDGPQRSPGADGEVAELTADAGS